jgi:hypothetical protein
MTTKLGQDIHLHRQATHLHRQDIHLHRQATRLWAHLRSKSWLTQNTNSKSS